MFEMSKFDSIPTNKMEKRLVDEITQIQFLSKYILFDILTGTIEVNT